MILLRSNHAILRILYPYYSFLRILDLMKGFFSVCLLIFSLTAYGQNESIEIIGEIIDPEASEAVPYVHVINTTSKTGQVSNTEGRFWIKMNPNDTLVFSAIGFEKYIFTLNDNISTDKLVVTIELRHSTLELETVKIFAFKDEYALKRALIDAELPIETPHKGIQLPGFYYGPKKEVKVSALSPISFIYNKVSKEAKQARKLQEYEQDYDFRNYLKSKYNESIVIKITGIEEDKVDDFMNFCKLEDSFIKRASEYELTVVLHQCFTDFTSIDLIEN
jgi:hypothetical protein